jgi:hypothetical protein
VFARWKAIAAGELSFPPRTRSGGKCYNNGIPLTVHGSKDTAVVGIWESNFMTARQAMSLVAHAKPL